MKNNGRRIICFTHDQSDERTLLQLDCEMDQKPIQKRKVISRGPDFNMWTPMIDYIDLILQFLILPQAEDPELI